MKIGIVGVSGFGGGELLRLCASHPTFEIAYVGGESSAGKTLAQLFPAMGANAAGRLVVEPFVPEKMSGIELLFVSLPTGKSREPLARVPASTRIVDVGGDHRFVDGWTYGLTELPGQRERIRGSSRIANPGCYPAAALLALAPLVKAGLVESQGIIIDAATGVTGTGRGGASDFGYVDTSEDVFAYGLESHPHVPEMEKALAQVGGSDVTIAFTPHLVPMKRGILATCHARPRGKAAVEKLYEAANALYRDEPFVRVTPTQSGRSPAHALGDGLESRIHLVRRQSAHRHVIAMGAIDNLGKGAAAQAVQNAKPRHRRARDRRPRRIAAARLGEVPARPENLSETRARAGTSYVEALACESPPST
jgi:N-acetyl-gamma-glutamyl-phosphate reductase